MARYNYGERLLQPAPRWRLFACRAFAGGGIFTAIIVIVFLATIVQGRSDALLAGAGFCVAQPSVVSAPLRWGASASVADQICCRQRDYAEYSGYWETTSFPRELPAGATNITFFDSASGKPLFVAPVGRSYDAFIRESMHHGWPSFRDAEVVWDNVRVQHDGETQSVDRTHLGHLLPDSAGNRYCIDLVCIAAQES